VGLVIFPLASLRDISSLRFASGAAIAIYAVFVIALLCLWADGPPPQQPPSAFQSSVAGYVRAVPICAFAFMCQTSLFPIYGETDQPTPPRMRRLTGAAFAAAGSLYVLTGVAAYCHFGEDVRGNVLLNLAALPSPAIRAVRLAFATSICLTYPCLHFAARCSLDQLLFRERRASRRIPLTLAIVGSSLLLALVVEKVEVVFGFTGAAASTALSFGLPAAIDLRLGRAAALRERAGSWALLLVGSGLGAVSLANHARDVILEASAAAPVAAAARRVW